MTQQFLAFMHSRGRPRTTLLFPAGKADPIENKGLQTTPLRIPLSVHFAPSTRPGNEKAPVISRGFVDRARAAACVTSSPGWAFPY